MSDATGSKRKPRERCERIRFYPGWLVGREEQFLSRMALRGWSLTSVSGESAYLFSRAQPAQVVYAVEFLGRRPNVPDEIARDCNAGWDYAGSFGRKRYYRRTPEQAALPHPSSDSEAEQLRLSATLTNLTTILLLNVPGTLYCLLYTVLLLATDGLSIITFRSAPTLYLFGALLGVGGIFVLIRWILEGRRRGRSISAGG